MRNFFGFLGFIFPIAAWLAFGGVCIAALAWAREDHLSWILATAVLFFGYRAGRASRDPW
jgi:hypothetical protein